MPHQSIIPQWEIEQRKEQNRRLFDQNIAIANHHCWLALHGPRCERKSNARLAEHYIERALVFSEGGPQA